MWASTPFFVLLVLTAVSASPSTSICPFEAPTFPQDRPDSLLELFRRQNYCQAGYNGCSNLGVATVCCPTTATCTPDSQNHVACCPTGALCTGALGQAGSISTTTGAFLGVASITTTTAGSAATTTGANLILASSTFSFPPESTVANPYFPFLYIPTSFPNDAVCSSYYSSCSAEFSSCTQSLGGGVTVQGDAVTSEVASICSSLYNEGCYGLGLGYCSSPSGTSLTGSSQTAAGSVATGSGIIVNANRAGRERDVGIKTLIEVALAAALVLVVRL